MEALKRLEEALDPYAPYIFITIFLWFLGGWLYETLSRVVDSPTWKAKSVGTWSMCKHISGAIVERLRQGRHPGGRRDHRRKREERDAERREPEISGVPEKNEPVRDRRIGDLEGTKG